MFEGNFLDREFCGIYASGDVLLRVLGGGSDWSNTFERVLGTHLFELPSSVATPDEPPPSLLPAPFPAVAEAARAAAMPGPLSVTTPLAVRAAASPPGPNPTQVPFFDDAMENLALSAADAPVEAVAREFAA